MTIFEIHILDNFFFGSISERQEEKLKNNNRDLSFVSKVEQYPF